MQPHETERLKREFIAGFDRHMSLLAECVTTEWYRIEDDGRYRLISQQIGSGPIRFAALEKLEPVGLNEGEDG